MVEIKEVCAQGGDKLICLVDVVLFISQRQRALTKYLLGLSGNVLTLFVCRYVIFSMNQLAKGFSQMTGNMQGLPLFINRVTVVMLTITAQYQ